MFVMNNPELPKKPVKKSIKLLLPLNREKIVKSKLSPSLVSVAHGRMNPIAGKKVRTSLAILSLLPKIEYLTIFIDL